MDKKKDGTKEEILCLKAVAAHNDLMGGLDYFDQRKERYQVRRRFIKWWHLLFSY